MQGDPLYYGAVFLGGVSFDASKFPKGVGFARSQFRGRAYFDDSRLGKADFSSCVFEGPAIFRGASFVDADFSNAVFKSDADFTGASFSGRTSFAHCRFEKGVAFDLTRFRTDDSSAYLDMRRVQFAEASKAFFYRVNHHFSEDSPGLLVVWRGCDLRGVRFEDVRWFRRGGRLTVADELDADETYREGYYPDTHPSRETVAAIYRQLQNCFEATRSYTLAEECAVGVMEMKRLDRSANKVERWVVETYRLLSVYGTSYERACGIVLALVFVLFPLMFALPGMELVRAGQQSNAPTRPESYRSVFESRTAHALTMASYWIGVSRMKVSAGLMHSVETATFQRSPIYAPGNLATKLLTIVEGVCVPIQVALALLAIRRRFRH